MFKKETGFQRAYTCVRFHFTTSFSAFFVDPVRGVRPLVTSVKYSFNTCYCPVR